MMTGYPAPFRPGLTPAEARAAADRRQVEDVFLRRNGAETRDEFLAAGCPGRLVEVVQKRIRDGSIRGRMKRRAAREERPATHRATEKESNDAK